MSGQIQWVTALITIGLFTIALIGFATNFAIDNDASINLDDKPSNTYGGALVILGILILITLVGAFSSDSPILMLFSFLIGVVLLMGLNIIGHTAWVGGTATILFLVIAIIIVG